MSGKIRGQRAKAMKFVDGLLIHVGHPVHDYIQEAVRHVILRQGKDLRCIVSSVLHLYPFCYLP